jgi:hypothetical protein
MLKIPTASHSIYVTEDLSQTLLSSSRLIPVAGMRRRRLLLSRVILLTSLHPFSMRSGKTRDTLPSDFVYMILNRRMGARTNHWQIWAFFFYFFQAFALLLRGQVNRFLEQLLVQVHFFTQRQAQIWKHPGFPCHIAA